MIVRPAQHVLHLITQPDHAALAGRVMQHCTPLQQAEGRESILLAISEHDNGWRELDDEPTLDASGRVVDFVSGPSAPKQAVWPRGVSRLVHHPYAAALVAHHAVFVYDRYRSEPEWATFFPRMEAMRDEMLERARQSREQLLRDYLYVRVGDLISLMFCTGWTDEQRHEGWTVRRDGNRIHVTPQAFDAAEIPFEILARELPDRPFGSTDEFREVFAAARQVSLTGSLARG